MKDEIDYKSCETIEELKKHQKPFVVVLNTKTPYTLAVKQLTKKLQEMYKVTVVPMDCASMDLEDISQLMKKILFEFPVCQVDFETPGWFDVLKSGGVLAMSFNTHVTRREGLVRLFEKEGFEIVQTANLEHWVEQAISRDVILARKP